MTLKKREAAHRLVAQKGCSSHDRTSINAKRHQAYLVVCSFLRKRVGVSERERERKKETCLNTFRNFLTRCTDCMMCDCSCARVYICKRYASIYMKKHDISTVEKFQTYQWCCSLLFSLWFPCMHTLLLLRRHRRRIFLCWFIRL